MSIYVFYKSSHKGSSRGLSRIEADTDCHVEAISAVRQAVQEEKRIQLESTVLALIEGGK